jgi:hypothetical protein
MSIELKIKSKHLSQEARIIRFEERKLLKTGTKPAAITVSMLFVKIKTLTAINLCIVIEL